NVYFDPIKADESMLLTCFCCFPSCPVVVSGNDSKQRMLRTVNKKINDVQY
ncbi:MAG: hypothetical protein ACI8RD_011154, partial [Bacillariaceae sp.]